MTHKSRLIWLAILLTGPVIVLTKDPDYTRMELDTGHTAGRAWAINERGQIVGSLYCEPYRRAVMWDDDGSIIARATTHPPFSSEAYDINNRGQVVGVGTAGAALWEDGTMLDVGGIDLGPLIPVAIMAINNRGQIVGRIQTEIGWTHAALWDNGPIVDLGVLPGDISSGAVAINNRGQIIGWSHSVIASGDVRWRAYIWDKGTMSELPGLDGEQYTFANDINDRGQVVGQSGPLPVMWENGIAIPLDILPPFARGAAGGINNNGDIVGTLTSSTSSAPVLWQNGTPVTLPTVFDPTLEWRDSARDINNSGTIVGSRDSFNHGECSFPLVWVRNARAKD